MFQIEKLHELQTKVESWGKKVGLYDDKDGSNLMMQTLKFYEEYGETCKYFLKKNEEEIIDGIGDQFVCLVHCQKFGKAVYLGKLNEPFHIRKFIIDEHSDKSFVELLSLIPGYVEKNDYNAAVTLLLLASYNYTGDPYKCIEAAYNEIKDREGKMIGGTFIKRKDLEEMGQW